MFRSGTYRGRRLLAAGNFHSPPSSCANGSAAMGRLSRPPIAHYAEVGPALRVI